jgi:hypothetical protein
MRTSGLKESKNFRDQTSWLAVPMQTTFSPAAAINYQIELTPEEARAMDRLGLSLQDILAARQFGSGAVMRGKRFRK